MKVRTPMLFAFVLVTLFALYSPGFLQAQMGVGEWTRQPTTSTPGDVTMKVETCCDGGRRLTYTFKIGTETFVMVVESPFNGAEVPVLLNGKPSGETMAIKRVDELHLETVLKMDGQMFGTSKGTLSADGRTLTVVNNITFAAAGQTIGVQTEVWKKK
jgi:hypothetical protein